MYLKLKVGQFGYDNQEERIVWLKRKTNSSAFPEILWECRLDGIKDGWELLEELEGFVRRFAVSRTVLGHLVDLMGVLSLSESRYFKSGTRQLEFSDKVGTVTWLPNISPTQTIFIIGMFTLKGGSSKYLLNNVICTFCRNIKEQGGQKD